MPHCPAAYRPGLGADMLRAAAGPVAPFRSTSSAPRNWRCRRLGTEYRTSRTRAVCHGIKCLALLSVVRFALPPAQNWTARRFWPRNRSPIRRDSHLPSSCP